MREMTLVSTACTLLVKAQRSEGNPVAGQTRTLRSPGCPALQPTQGKTWT